MLNDTNTAYSTECNFYGVSNTANLQPQRGEITNQVNGVDRVRSSIKRPWVNRSRPIISATTRASGNCLAIPGNFRRRASVVQRSTDDQCRLPRNRRIKFAGLRREMSTTNLYKFPATATGFNAQNGKVFGLSKYTCRGKCCDTSCCPNSSICLHSSRNNETR